ncbi:synaptonemal complex central element protein 2 [Lampris incognitus]|uniref:synaptonemal complex central element protein 2 n=1 Tax=Lampris incognitus TaxID=2546036 RepID=UPI0024B58074|nr:synaptonemal complex central element protein 2 [Lampris incognitus]
MAEFFTGALMPNCQSTPKPGRNPGKPSGNPGKPSGKLCYTRVISSPLSSEDSGAVLDISTITEGGQCLGGETPFGETSETGCTSFPFSSKIKEIEKKAQDLIDRIPQNRDKDQEIINTFESKLLSKVSEACQQVKDQLFTSYEEHGHEMEASLQELSEVLERSSQLSSELQGVSQTLLAINTGLLQTPGQSERY